MYFITIDLKHNVPEHAPCLFNKVATNANSVSDAIAAASELAATSNLGCAYEIEELTCKVLPGQKGGKLLQCVVGYSNTSKTWSLWKAFIEKHKGSVKLRTYGDALVYDIGDETSAAEFEIHFSPITAECVELYRIDTKEGSKTRMVYNVNRIACWSQGDENFSVDSHNSRYQYGGLVDDLKNTLEANLSAFQVLENLVNTYK
jgi:hypothetical protein